MNLKKLVSSILAFAMISSAVAVNAAYVGSFDDYDTLMIEQEASEADIMGAEAKVTYTVTEVDATEINAWAGPPATKAPWLAETVDVYKVTATITGGHKLYTGYLSDYSQAALQLYSINARFRITEGYENFQAVKEESVTKFNNAGSTTVDSGTQDDGTVRVTLSWNAANTTYADMYPSFTDASYGEEKDIVFTASCYIRVAAGTKLTCNSDDAKLVYVQNAYEQFDYVIDEVSFTIPETTGGDDDDDDPVYDEGYVAVDSIQGLTAEFAAKYEGKFFFTEKLDLAGKAATAHITISRGEEAPKTIERDLATLLGIDAEVQPTITAGSIAVTVVTDAADVNPFTFVIE